MLFLEPLGGRARERLRRLVQEFKGNDPLAPVSVVVPSTYAGLDLRHDLARQGSINVRFLVLPRLTELLAAPALAAAGKKPLTGLLEAALVRSAALEAKGPLQELGHHPALHHTLQSSFRELRNAGDEALHSLESQGDLRAELVRLFREFRERTESGYYDRETLATTAARVVRDRAAPGLKDLGAIVFFLVTELSPGERALVEALGESGPCAVVLGLGGDQTADEPIRALAERLAPVLGPPREGSSAVPAPATSLLIGPDPQQEVRWVLRRLLRAAQDGLPFNRMAILYRQPAPYATLLQEELSLAEVAVSGPGNIPLAESATGRTLMGLLRLAGTELPRAALMSWLTGCPIRLPREGAVVRASQWDAISRQAGIVAGVEQWQQRLEDYAASLERQADEGLKLDEIADSRADGMRAEAAAARALQEFVADLAGRLMPPADGAWPELARWARELLKKYLDSTALSSREAEEAALRRIEESLEELRGLDDVEPGPTLERFCLALEEALSAPVGHLGQTGQGVFTAPLGTALGMDFNLVFIVGMVEGAMPPRYVDDPLLPDRERQRAGGPAAGLRLRAGRGAEERYRYLAALASAKECVLTFPHGDPGARRAQFPSRWFLEAATGLHGAPVHTSDLWSLGPAPWLNVVASVEDGLRHATGQAAADAHDLDVSELWRWTQAGMPLEAHPLASAGHLKAAVALEKDRPASRLTPWDGDVSIIVSGTRTLNPLNRQALAASSLQDWARCPFRYFLARVLRVAAIEQPEEIMTISRLEKGALVHAVLECFIRTVRDAGSLPAPGHPWSAEHHALLQRLAGEALAGAEARGGTGNPLLWELEQQTIRADLDAFLAADDRMRERLGVTPVRVEVSFGLPINEEGAALPPATRDIPGLGRVRFRGMIDRVDADACGTGAIVIDYKTGSDTDYRAIKKDPVDAGRHLQLPIYILALQQGMPEGASVRAAYWFVSSGERFAFQPPELLDWETVAGPFEAAVSTIARGISAGLFPANPGKEEYGGFANCRWCGFDPICPSRRDVVWERKRHDARLAAYLELGTGDTGA